MKLAITILLAVSTTCFADTYKCPSAGGMVYQDSPCKTGGTRVAVDTPAAAVSKGSEDAREKLEKDKAYIDERVKARRYDREKDQSSEQIANCEAEVVNLQNQVDAVMNRRGTIYNNNLAGAVAAQAENQHRQTEVIALQGKISSKRSQCDAMRREHDKRFQK